MEDSLIRATYLAFVATVFIHSTTAVIIFQCESEHCPNQQVEYQCIVFGSGAQTWRIRSENGAGQTTIQISSSSRTAVTVGDFRVEQLSQSPIRSNISFTVRSRIDGHTIQCEDQIGDSETCTINIVDPPSSPNNLSLLFTGTSLHVSWVQPSFSSRCVTNYVVSSNATTMDITTTDTHVDIPLAGLSSAMYCVSVVAIDSANRVGTQSEETCFQLKGPSVQMIMYEVFIVPGKDSASSRISWTFDQSRPLPTAVYLSHNVSGTVVTEQLPANQTHFNVHNILKDTYYTVTVFGKNVLGSSPNATLSIFVDDDQTPLPPPVTTEPASMPTPNTATNPMHSGSPSQMQGADLNSCSSLQALYITLTLILTAVVATFISSILTLLLTKRYYTKRDQQPQINLYEVPVSSRVMAITDNPAYNITSTTTSQVKSKISP